MLLKILKHSLLKTTLFTVIKKEYKNEYAGENLIVDHISFKSPTFSTAKYQHHFNKASEVPIGKNKSFMKPKSLIISPVSIFDMKSNEEMKNFLENSLKSDEVYINYPYKSLSKLTGIVWNNSYLFLKDGKIQYDSFAISNEMKTEFKNFLKSKGMHIENFSSNVFLEIIPFDRYVRTQNGNIKKIFHEKDKYFIPIEISSLNSIDSSFIIRYKGKEENMIKDYEVGNEFSKSNKAIVLTSNNYGKLARVEEIINNNDKDYTKYNELNYSSAYYDSNKNYDLTDNDWKVELKELYDNELVKVCINNEEDPTSFNINKASEIPVNAAKNILKSTDEFYLTMDEIANELKLSNFVINVITSHFLILENDDDPNSKRWTIGLSLKMEKGVKMIVPGYSRYSQNSYTGSYNLEFSSIAVQLIKEYKNNYKFLIDALENLNDKYRRDYTFYFDELFGDKVEIKDNLDGVFKWISTQEISGSTFCSQNSNYLNKKDIKKIFEFVQSKLENGNNLNSNSVIKDTFVLNPGYLVSEKFPFIERFSDIQYFDLGDRVINIRSDDKKYIPFGMIGTITGISENILEVMFDYPFIGGENCSGRLPNCHGMYIQSNNLINITKKGPVFLRRNVERIKNFALTLNEMSNMDDCYKYPNNLKDSYQQPNLVLNNSKSMNNNTRVENNGNKYQKDYGYDRDNRSFSTNNNSKNNVDLFFENHQDYSYSSKNSNIESFKDQKNVSNYKTNRLFNNENIPSNGIYYFTNDKESYNLQKNQNKNIV